MDLIEGLKCGFFHILIEGNYKERLEVYNTKYKEYVEKGYFNREITNAPRDHRYKIDLYAKENYSKEDTLCYNNFGFFDETLKFIGVDETFNWFEKLKKNSTEYDLGDFTLGYGKINFCRDLISSGYYFKYKGEYNKLKFSSSPKIVDYTESFWRDYENKVGSYKTIDELIHNIGFFIKNKKLSIK